MLFVIVPIDMTEDAYHFENPYHNSTHATDVLQALHCLLQEEVCVCVCVCACEFCFLSVLLSVVNMSVS